MRGRKRVKERVGLEARTWIWRGFWVKRVPMTCPRSFSKKRIGSRAAFAHTTHGVTFAIASGVLRKTM